MKVNAGSSKRVENAIEHLQEVQLEDDILFPPEKWKTLIVFIFAMFGFISTLFIISVIHERVPDQGKYPPLSDIMLDILPENIRLMIWSEIHISIISIGIPILFIFHKHRFIVVRRIFFIVGLLYCMRSVTMFVTVLPVSTTDKYCAPKSNNTNFGLWFKRAWRLGTGFGLMLHGNHKYCGDLVFSGHSVIVCMGSLVFSEYTPRKMFILHWVSWVITFSSMLTILWAHQHYTVDVIIAYYVTTRIFWLYHMIANNPELKESSDNNYISRVWWFRVVQYLEKNVKAPVPPVFELPCPPFWKRFSRKRQ